MSLSNLLTENDGEYSLSYGGINYPLKKELMAPEKIKFADLSVNTFSPATLLHTYSFVGGLFREKDWKNALTFSRWLNKEDIKYEHADYEPFHKFGRERWNSSPLRKIQNVWRNMVNALPENLRDKLLETYGSPIVKNVRGAFSVVEEATCGHNIKEENR
jgi:hypothetical protein